MDTRDLKRFADAELVGERARLRPIRVDDAPRAFGLLSDDRVTRTLLWDGPASVEAVSESYQSMGLPGVSLGGDASYTFAIEAADTPGIIGSIGARLRPHPQQIDIGYWLGVPYWGAGIMTDAVRLVTHFSFEQLDALRVYATVFTGNVASRRVLEKCGFALDGTLRQQVPKRGEWLDEWFLTLLRAEWEPKRDEYRPSDERRVERARP